MTDQYFTVAKAPDHDVVMVKHYGKGKIHTTKLGVEETRALAASLVTAADRAEKAHWRADGAPQTREEVTAGWTPAGYRGPDTYDKHDERL